MSLINDALKRAKQAQQPGSALPAANPHLRPVESSLPPHPGLGLIVPAALALVALLLLFFVWQWARVGGRSRVTEVRAQTTEESTIRSGVPGSSGQNSNLSGALSQATDTPSSKAPALGMIPTGSSPRESSQGTNQIPETALAKTAPTGIPSVTPKATNLDLAVKLNADTNVRVQVEKPMPLRLQGIVYTPNRPSAVINGRTLFVGDRIREFRVAAISRDSVTLATGSVKQVLNLDE